MKRHPSRSILVVCALALSLLAHAATQAAAITPKQLANKVLRLDPRKPADIDLFTSRHANGGQGLYPAGSAMTPDDGPVPSEAQVRQRLKSFLQAQFPDDSRKVNAALKLFNDPDVKSRIPEPQPRAAVVGMKGSLLEPTINFGLSGDRFALVRTGTLPDSSFIAGSSGGDTNRVVTVNSRYRSEDFRYLIGIMGHEFLHHDFGNDPNTEEAILNSLSAMTYIQVLIDHPELAHTGTELSRQMNDLALVFLNSRENDSPTSEVYAPSGVGVAPGSRRNEPDIWSIFDGNSTTFPAPGVLSQVLRSLGMPRASRFSLSTAKTFKDLNDKWLSDVGRVQVSVLLRLVSVKTIANKADLSRSQVSSRLHLRPYLDAIK